MGQTPVLLSDWQLQVLDPQILPIVWNSCLYKYEPNNHNIGNVERILLIFWEGAGVFLLLG